MPLLILNFISFLVFMYMLSKSVMSSKDPRESQPHKVDLTSKLNSKTVPVLLSLDPSLIFPFHLLPFPVHPTGFSICFFPGFLAIFILSLTIQFGSYNLGAIMVNRKIRWREGGTFKLSFACYISVQVF